MTRSVIFGATGYAGGHILAEAVSRGHDVVAVARDVESLRGRQDVEARPGSLADEAFVADVSGGADVLISALPGQALTGALAVLLAAARHSGARVGVVGGAGSLLVGPDGPLLMDTPDFPDQARDEAAAQLRVLTVLRGTQGVDWFYVSPAATFGAFAPGVRRGSFRTGGDLLLADSDGGSSIGGADYALAFVDEIDKREYRNLRVSVAY